MKKVLLVLVSALFLSASSYIDGTVHCSGSFGTIYKMNDGNYEYHFNNGGVSTLANLEQANRMCNNK